MKELPFDPYDFFGYIASGLVLVAVCQLVFGFPLVFGVDLKPFDAAVTILTVYVVGQLVAGPAKLLLEDGLAQRVLGSPTKNLLRTDTPRVGRFLFPGYFKPLPANIQANIQARIAKMDPPPRDSEETFLSIRYCPAVLDDERLLTKIDRFRNQYGFARNISFSLWIAAVLLCSGGHTMQRVDLVRYGMGATGAAVLILYRFLKFYRQYSYELLNCFSRTDKGNN